MIINNFDIVKSFQNSLQFIYSYLSFWCSLNQQFWHRPQYIQQFIVSAASELFHLNKQ